MTDEEIVALWRQHKEVMGFAHALLAAEREACAKVCKEVLEQYRGTDMGKHAEMVGDNCAAAIRERGNT